MTATTEITYYDRPVLKPPVWIWTIPAYFFVGGVAGAGGVGGGGDVGASPVNSAGVVDVGVGGVAGLPLERLEHEMLSLSGHLAAATCSFLVMVGEYDARGGWESWESYSCAHWLNWRCGVGMVAAREQVRVAGTF